MCLLYELIFPYFQKYKATTLRRYNDFLALHELLVMRFPYRIIPRLPPKKMMGGMLYKFFSHIPDAIFRDNPKSAYAISSFLPTGYQPAVMIPEVMYFEWREVIMPGKRCRS